MREGRIVEGAAVGRSERRETPARAGEQKPTAIRESNADIPEWLVAIIDKLHAKDPAERYQSAAEIAELLGRHLAHVQHPSVVKQVSVLSPEPKAGLKQASRRRLAIAAALFLCLLTGLCVTEATGVTNFRATVIRIFTPDGTLVVEINDPGVKVTIEGDGGLVITGAGLEEIRLRPGSYKVHADRDGKRVPLDRELVSITKNGREVVKVKLEAPPTPVVAKTATGAFVLLAAGKERKFDTLAEAVQGATDGDIIEVRGNGPFVCGPVKATHALTIRAGDGCRPVLQFAENLRTAAALVLEGLELQRVGQKVPKGFDESLVFSWGSSLHFVNCRFREHLELPCVTSNAPNCVVRNCEFLSLGALSLRSKKCVIDNCLEAGGTAVGGGMLSVEVGSSDQPDISVQLTRCTLRCPSHPLRLQFVIQPDKFRDKDAKRVHFDASGTIFDAPAVVVVYAPTPCLARLKLQPEDGAAVLLRMLAWRDQGNLYAPGGSLLHWTTYPEGVSRKFGPRSLFTKNRGNGTILNDD